MNGPHVFNETISYPGRAAVGTILKELEREQESRKDLVINSSQLKMQVIDDQLLMRVPNPKTKDTFLLPLTNRVHSQIAQWMHLRMGDGFYKYLMAGAFKPGVDPKNKRNNWDLFCDTFNGFAKKRGEGRMIRMIHNREKTLYCRAFLSNKFQIIDSCDYFYTIVGALKKMGAEVWHARLSDDKFYGYAVHPGTSETIDLTKSANPNSHDFKRFARKGQDEIHPAMIFGNSETGEGGCFLRQALLWTYCVNYCVTAKVINKTHIGRRREEEELLKAETIKKENEVFFLKTADIVESTFNPEVFRKFVDKLKGANDDEVKDPEAAADALRICYDVSEDAKNAIRNMFLLKYPQTRYGLIGAVTEYGHDKTLDADAGFMLEELGAKLIHTDMAGLLKSADKEKKRQESKPQRRVAAMSISGAELGV